MKSLKKLKIFILAVGLACGVQLVNVSAMDPYYDDAYDAIIEDRINGGKIPNLRNKLSLKKTELNQTKQKLKQLEDNKDNYLKDKANFYDFEYNTIREVVDLSLNNPIERARREKLQKAYLERKEQLTNSYINNYKEYGRKKNKLQMEDIKCNEEIKQLNDKLHDLKKLEDEKEHRFCRLICIIFDKNYDLTKLKIKRALQNQRYREALQDFNQSNSENVMKKREKYLKEMKKLQKLDDDCKQLQNEIKEKDNNLKKLGKELNELDDKTSKGSIKLGTLSWASEDFRVNIYGHDKLDMRKNGTSKYLENFQYRIEEVDNSDL